MAGTRIVVTCTSQCFVGFKHEFGMLHRVACYLCFYPAVVHGHRLVRRCHEHFFHESLLRRSFGDKVRVGEQDELVPQAHGSAFQFPAEIVLVVG